MIPLSISFTFCVLQHLLLWQAIPFIFAPVYYGQLMKLLLFCRSNPKSASKSDKHNFLFKFLTRFVIQMLYVSVEMK